VPALLRLLLLPFGYGYAAAAWLRRRYFVFAGKRKKSPVYSIAIGNLAVGGSGKTPMAMFLSAHSANRTAMLSRGYKRKTRGFRMVDVTDTADRCGDEPLEMKIANPQLPVFVCENRLEGIAGIRQHIPEVETIILDDAFQHLPLLANKYVLLTDYQKPFYDDLPMPAGRLREFACTASAADVIVVTKCPPDLDETTAAIVRQKLNKYGKPVFFCHYENADPLNAMGAAWNPGKQVIVVSGLADNHAFLDWSKQQYSVIRHFAYPDHYAFTHNEYSRWAEAAMKHEDAVFLTTRKDFARMNDLPDNLKKRFFMTFTTPKFLFKQEDAFIRILFNHY
jgi:tetraacyldisaccharide 4'-kinase